MGAHEQELQRIVDASTWEVPSLGPLEAALQNLQTSLKHLQTTEAWRGKAADAANEKFAAMSKSYEDVRSAVDSVQRIVTSANTHLDAAKVAYHSLPSHQVPRWLAGVVEEAREAGHAVVAPLPDGPEFTVDSAIDGVAAWLTGNREDAARQALQELRTSLAVEATKLAVPTVNLTEVARTSQQQRDSNSVDAPSSPGTSPGTGPGTSPGTTPRGGGGGAPIRHWTPPRDTPAPPPPHLTPTPVIGIQPPIIRGPEIIPPETGYPPHHPGPETGGPFPPPPVPTPDPRPPFTSQPPATTDGPNVGIGLGLAGGAAAAGVVGFRLGAGGLPSSALAGGFGSGSAAGPGATGASGGGLAGSPGAPGGGLGASGAGGGSASQGAAGNRQGMLGGGQQGGGQQGGGKESNRKRSRLGGPVAPKLEDDEEFVPQSDAALAGSRDDDGVE